MKYKTYMKILAPGLIVTGLACYGLYTSLDDAWQELKLMRNHETCSGYIIEIWEEMIGETDYGKLMWEYWGIYTYRLPDGREFTQYTRGHGRLKPEILDHSMPYPIEVEYLPDNPAISRIKGDGPNNILSWLRSEVADWGLLTFILLAVGVYLLLKAVRELRNQDNNIMGITE
jgi:hypothetical protein